MEHTYLSIKRESILLYFKYKSKKDMWDSFQTRFEGAEDVKDSKINMLIEEFELFCMEPKESVESMLTCFLHLINKLKNL